MKVKLVTVRNHIEEVRVRHLRFERDLERYELIMEQLSGQYDVSIAAQELDALRRDNRFARPKIRKYVAALEKALKEDEVANGWKGEERYIEL